MKTNRSDRSVTQRGRRGIVLLVAGALAMGLGVTGVHAALVGGSSAPRTRPDPTVMRPVPPVTPVVTSARPSPTTEPTPDSNALADGVYPTYIHAVNIRGASITVDVIQIFEGEAAHKAAIEDGVPWTEMAFGPFYIRNVNPLLRTLPVARDVRIKLIGVCVSPSRLIGLTELRQATKPFTTTFYYDVSVVGGSVEGIQQFVAVAAC